MSLFYFYKLPHGHRYPDHFYFYTSEEQSKQNFFNPDCKFSCNAEESRYYCEIISKTWGIADKGHNPFVFCDLVSFWTEHWHLIYIRYP